MMTLSRSRQLPFRRLILLPNVRGNGVGETRRLPDVRDGVGAQSAWKAPAAKTIYTCPMHPQIQQDHPGDCPICGMTLELKTLTADAPEDDAELRDMTRRMWIGGFLALPVFLVAMLHLIPAFGHLSGSTAIGLAGVSFSSRRRWCSGPRPVFSPRLAIDCDVESKHVHADRDRCGRGLRLQRGGHAGARAVSALDGHGRKVGIYFEAAAVIVVLVLLGQVLELRARSRTGSAIKALLNLAPPTARVVGENGDEEVALAHVKVGDRLRVVPVTKCRLTALSWKAAATLRNR